MKPTKGLPPMVLASGSRYKQAMLARLMMPFTIQAADIDETPDAHQSPRENAERLAEAKARVLVESRPGSLIIGADQVLAFENTILHKPGTVENAVAQLQRLLGKRHTLHTAVYLICSERKWTASFCVDTHLHLYPDIPAATLRAMVTADKTWDCVGGYKYESRGIALMQSVETVDPSAVVGLPLLQLNAVLRGWGYPG
ncbi:Maf family protein [Acanthopleuribacter pedis]|uniref:7-methyl-GTP pyrophosphatase n=1 Tax=Acanthopleuribacter pedis TaxID=442870 RepID=A0A8J7QCL8_9BACT|nr:Maf family nucleotide pyrophosphatase [Acanthopleuribacter pedis]MBO1317090.1 septum formation protein Maf [Acanthopleuribacter pedis]